MKAIVIGAGPNGLTAAATLKKAGVEVTLVDQRGVPGGRFGGEIPLLHDTSLVSPAVLKDLGVDLAFQDAPTPHLPDGTAQSTPQAWGSFLATWRPLIRSIAEAPAPDIGDEAPLWPLARKAIALRKPGTARMMDLLRLAPQNLEDLLGEFFEDPRQRALRIFPALLGSWMGPISPTAGANLILTECLRGQEPVGGTAGLVKALLAAAPSVTRARVTGIRIEKGRVLGVDTDQGAMDADRVISCVGPITTLKELVHPTALPDHLHKDLYDVRVRGCMAKLHLALSAPLFPQELVRTCDAPLDLERAFDDVKHRRLPRRPPLEVRQLAGGKSASVLIHCAANDLDGGWTAEARAGLEQAVLAELRAHVPDLDERVSATELITPNQLQADWGLDGGHPFQAELAVDQLFVMRPLPRVARGETGITGLGLGSDGQHPGVGPTLVPGWLAAKAALSA